MANKTESFVFKYYQNFKKCLSLLFLFVSSMSTKNWNFTFRNRNSSKSKLCLLRFFVAPEKTLRFVLVLYIKYCLPMKMLMHILVSIGTI